MGPQHCRWNLVGTAGERFPNHESNTKPTKANPECVGLAVKSAFLLYRASVFTSADGVLPTLMTRAPREKEAGGDHGQMRAITSQLAQPSRSVTITERLAVCYHKLHCAIYTFWSVPF